ncbi:GerMN domain-containing protein [Angustibacter luteus]|uniref:GerMN domain-containing protein n=1 Tax=Angustibacter luteus TaxID=658456 RepID=A0ABW1JEM8_9ACTN
MTGRRIAAAALCLVALGGCGLPADGDPRAIRSGDVPYGLLSPSPNGSATASPDLRVREAEPRTYLLDADQQLVAVPTPVDTSSLEPREQLAVQLKMLSAGPTDRQRAAGLSTALTPGVDLALVDLVDGLATLEVQAAAKDPSADRLPLAVGQIVLTATTVPGVRSVQIVRDGKPVEVPLPGGALTAEPLLRSDYRELIARPAPTPQTTSG